MSKASFFTTPIVHPEFSGIRITPNVYTTLWELDRFCSVVEDVAKKGLPEAHSSAFFMSIKVTSPNSE
ncbi:MAG: hypothetical protein R2682_11060 [Pyrinomonadaceae bacterium]